MLKSINLLKLRGLLNFWGLGLQPLTEKLPQPCFALRFSPKPYVCRTERILLRAGGVGPSVHPLAGNPKPWPTQGGRRMGTTTAILIDRLANRPHGWGMAENVVC